MSGRARFVAAALVVALAYPPQAISAGFTVALRIANHRPIVGRRWPIELTVSSGRRRLAGTVRYEFMFAGVVVRTQPRHGAFKFRHGVYRDELIFPEQSVGQPLTLRFLVRTEYGTEHADWTLKVRGRRHHRRHPHGRPGPRRATARGWPSGATLENDA